MPRKKKTTDEQLADAELEEQKLKAIIEGTEERLLFKSYEYQTRNGG